MWRLLATGFRADRSKAGGAVGERGQLGVGGSTDGLKAASGHHDDLRVGLRHGAEHLSAIAGQNRVIVGLDRDYRLLQASEDLLRHSRDQPQLRDLPRPLSGLISSTSMTHAGPSIPVSTKRKTHAIGEPLASNPSAGHIACVLIPHILDTPLVDQGFKRPSLLGAQPNDVLFDRDLRHGPIPGNVE
jgi:hypothetical protein